MEQSRPINNSSHTKNNFNESDFVNFLASFPKKNLDEHQKDMARAIFFNITDVTAKTLSLTAQAYGYNCTINNIEEDFIKSPFRWLKDKSYLQDGLGDSTIPKKKYSSFASKDHDKYFELCIKMDNWKKAWKSGVDRKPYLLTDQEKSWFQNYHLTRPDGYNEAVSNASREKYSF
jgi:hypothetical protein